LDVDRIYVQRAALEYPRAHQILQRFPSAERVEVDSHWRISELHGNQDLVPSWNKVKRTSLVLGVKSSLSCRPNGRSADYIAPSHSNGCAMSCAYCYVPRRKGFANPITVFVNIEEEIRYLQRFCAKLPAKEPNQCDPRYWTFDIGESSDCALDAMISDNVRDLVEAFRYIPNGKATFATKFVNRDLLGHDPQGKTRLRFSLMPQAVAKVVDVRTSKISDRIAAIDEFVEAGYEVHLNLSPVIVADGWQDHYRDLLREVDQTLNPRSKEQLKAEVIFLTHSEGAHELNLRWHPKAEELLWRPDLQEAKVNLNGGDAVRYRRGLKGRLVDEFRQLMAEELPYCEIRYAF